MTGAEAAWEPRATLNERGRYESPFDDPQDARGWRQVLQWAVERRVNGGLPPLPPEGVPRAAHRIAYPRTEVDEIRLTWVGHATVVMQVAGLNLVTDPIWSRRASPVRWAGPARISPPGLLFSELPPLDGVLLTHDHYDHLDDPTVRRLAERFADLRWYAPLGHGDWLHGRGARDIVEMDWGDEARIGREVVGTVTALPARHWTQRVPFGKNRRLWCSFAVRAPSGSSVYFGGDSGYGPVFRAIGDRLGPFDAVILPIGAYEPRWFMKPQHMSPEEAVQAYGDLGGRGTFMGVHWGTFQLTDEPVLEPPRRARSAWAAAALPESELWIPRIGGTRVVRLRGEADA